MNTLQQVTHSQKRQLIYEAIDAEREYQLKKYPREQSVGAYFTILRKELREAEDSWTDSDDLGATQQEVIQVAAVAIACLEQINKDMNRQYSAHGAGG